MVIKILSGGVETRTTKLKIKSRPEAMERHGVKIGNKNQNLFDRMNRIDRIGKPDSPAGRAIPLSRNLTSQKERRKGRDRIVRLSSPRTEYQSLTPFALSLSKGCGAFCETIFFVRDRVACLQLKFYQDFSEWYKKTLRALFKTSFLNKTI